MTGYVRGPGDSVTTGVCRCSGRSSSYECCFKGIAGVWVFEGEGDGGACWPCYCVLNGEEGFSLAEEGPCLDERLAHFDSTVFLSRTTGLDYFDVEGSVVVFGRGEGYADFVAGGLRVVSVHVESTCLLAFFLCQRGYCRAWCRVLPGLVGGWKREARTLTRELPGILSVLGVLETAACSR